MSDGANSQQQEILGQLFFRRDKNTGMLDSRVIAISSISHKTAAGQLVAYKEAMAALADTA
jgi:NAD(P)-dependent dehydrogenase (short-subunit alcohol dehydrogenase family)